MGSEMCIRDRAYFFLIVFVVALRRLRVKKDTDTGGGVSVIMRYTLRLLTIQQFRRLLTVMTACELLRVEGLEENEKVGWTPVSYGAKKKRRFIWGMEPFSAGLWVGGGVTPNRLGDSWMEGKFIPGAISILGGEKGEGEPAQVTHCPACSSILAVPEKGLSGSFDLHLVIRSDKRNIDLDQISNIRCGNIVITGAEITVHSSPKFFTLSLHLSTDGVATARDIDALWSAIRMKLPHIHLEAVRASRPGYFIRWYMSGKDHIKKYDFQIFCPNPRCPLHRKWIAMTPAGCVHGSWPGGFDRRSCHQPRCVQVPEPFQTRAKEGLQLWSCLSDRIPIPAYTVDEQIYSRLPSVVVATVDKFARLAFEPRASALFGNVTHYHCVWGYYRLNLPPPSAPNKGGHPVSYTHLTLPTN